MEADMKPLDRNELKELLVKCWMTHDGAWFYSCMQEFGIDAANRLNKAAIKSLSAIELRRVTDALGIKREGIETFDELKEVIDGMFSIVKGDFMDFEYDFPSENVMRWEMNKCFAYEGMKRIVAGDRYECGVLYRVACWIENLGVPYRMEPPVEGCLMQSRGTCSGVVRFDF
jgi:hypothetical protein